MEKKEYSLEIGGKTLTAQFTDLADQTNGSVILKYGDTTVLATAVMSEHEREGLNYFPLSVEFEEKFYCIHVLPLLLQMNMNVIILIQNSMKNSMKLA